MAVIKQGILGGFSGKVGGIVGTSWKGIGVMKAMPLSVANPKTAGQVNNRNRNTAVLRFAQGAGTTFIRSYWNRFAKGMSGFNEFMSVNYAAYNSLINFYDQTKMYTSVGKLIPMILGGLVVTKSSNIVQAVTARSSAADYVLGDLVDAVFFNATKGVGVQKLDNAASVTSISLPCPAAWDLDDEIYSFVSCRRADGTAVSTSVGVGSIVV
jgi:hypothetical protein